MSKKPAKKAAKTSFPRKGHKALLDIDMIRPYARDAYRVCVGSVGKIDSSGKRIDLPRSKFVSRLSRLKGKTIIGYKKAIIKAGYGARNENCAIVTLEIPANAARLQPLNYKCRASRAKVLAIDPMVTPISGDDKVLEVFSWHDSSFKYAVGQVVKPEHDFDRDKESECATGIHFFLTKHEAERYCF